MTYLNISIFEEIPMQLKHRDFIIIRQAGKAAAMAIVFGFVGLSFMALAMSLFKERTTFCLYLGLPPHIDMGDRCTHQWGHAVTDELFPAFLLGPSLALAMVGLWFGVMDIHPRNAVLSLAFLGVLTFIFYASYNVVAFS